MLSKSQHRAKSAVRRPMSDLSNEVFDSQARFGKKEVNKSFESAEGSLDRLLVARSDLSGLISQIDNLVAQAIKQKEISKKGYQEIESFIGFLSGICSSLKPWFARLQEALASTTTVTSRDQTITRETPFPLKPILTSKTETPKLNFTVSQSLANRSAAVPSKTQNENHSTPYPSKNTQERLLSSKTDSMQLDLHVSPSPLVSWRADHCTAVDGGKQLFLLTPLQKSRVEVSKGLLPTRPSIKEQDANTNKKHDNNIQDIVRISEQERETGYRQTPKAVLPAQTIFILPDFGTIKPQQRHHKTGAPTTCAKSSLRFCSTSKSALPTKPIPMVEPVHEAVIHGLPKSVLSNKQSTKVHEAVICGLPKSVLSNKQSTKVPDITADRMHEKHEEIGVLVTEPLPDVKVADKKKVVSDTLDWFFSPPKTCVLMEPSDKKRCADVKRLDLSTPVNNNDKNKGGDEKLPGTPWNELYMSVTCTKKGETTLKKELWTRFEAVSTSDLRLSADIFQKNDGKGFLDLLNEASN